jgi:broad specificity phosphatase PhoE
LELRVSSQTGRLADKNFCLAFLFSFESIIRSNKDIPWPGYGESVADVENRAMKGLEQLLRDFPACDHLCIVGHSHFNKILLTSLLGRHDQLVGNQGSTCVNVMDVDPDGK